MRLLKMGDVELIFPKVCGQSGAGTLNTPYFILTSSLVV